MNYIRQVFLVLMLLLLVATAFAKGNLYSRLAIPIWGNLWENGSVTVSSPDKKSNVRVTLNDKSEVVLEIVSRSGAKRFQIGPGVGSELLWSEDSNAFVVTASDGGLSGAFHVHVFRKNESGEFTQTNVEAAVEAAYGNPAECPIAPNFAAVKWLKSSTELLIVAQRVHYASECDGAETFIAYVVEVSTAKVVKSYDQITAKRLFASDIGDLLRNAPDSCVRNPASCRTRK